jgi:pyruvate, orthophosphate dikinase
LTYVSCSPFRVPVARLAAAQAALEEEAAKKAKKKQSLVAALGRARLDIKSAALCRDAATVSAKLLCPAWRGRSGFFFRVAVPATKRFQKE